MAGQQISKQQKMIAVESLKEATARQLPLLKSMRISEEAFARVTINALMKNPQLALCTKDSLFVAVFAAVDMGLMPDGRHGVIVPVKKNNVLTADFWPMVGGLLACVRRELKNAAIQAHNVFAGDQWEDIRGTSPQLVHVVNGGVDRLSEDSLVCSYSTVHFAGNDTPEFEVMYLPELHKFKKNNRGPWSTHPLEMYRVRVAQARAQATAGLRRTDGQAEPRRRRRLRAAGRLHVRGRGRGRRREGQPRPPAAPAGDAPAGRPAAGRSGPRR